MTRQSVPFTRVGTRVVPSQPCPHLIDGVAQAGDEHLNEKTLPAINKWLEAEGFDVRDVFKVEAMPDGVHYVWTYRDRDTKREAR